MDPSMFPSGNELVMSWSLLHRAWGFTEPNGNQTEFREYSCGLPDKSTEFGPNSLEAEPGSSSLLFFVHLLSVSFCHD